MINLQSEIEAIGRELSRQFARPLPVSADLRDLAQRFGRIEDALAGLRAGRDLPGQLAPHAQIIKRMVTFVCFALDERPSDLLSQRRAQKLAYGRFAIMWAAKALTPYSYPQIARALGGYDHTSIMYGCRRADELRDSDPDFRTLSDALLAHFSEPQTEKDQPWLL